VSSSPDITEPGLQADQRLVDRAWLRIGAGLLVVGQAMVFSLAINLTPPAGAAYWILHGGLVLATAAVLVFLGGDLVRGAVAALGQRRVTIDLLFLVTLAGAFGGSLMSTFTRTGSVYYEVVAILVVVHTMGRMLGARSRLAALQAVDRTRERFDQCWVRQPDGTSGRKTVRELAPDDVVLVAPGAPISVDGEITAGRGYVQETSMTGEWRPVPRGPGDPVLAGTVSIDGTFDLRPAQGSRRLDAVLAAVAEARLAPSALQQQADRLVAWFLPAVALVSLATFGFWIARAPWDRALFNAMAVLLVACPCAMGLATPVAVWGGLARLASFGLVARTGDFLDVLARCDRVCFDKTGTLSTDALAVRAWRMEPAFRDREAWLQAAVAAVEEGLSHPIATALQQRGNALRYKPVVIAARRLEPGLGVVAEIVAEVAAEVRSEAERIVEIRVGEWALGGEGAGPAAPADGSRESGANSSQVISRPGNAAETGGKEVYVFVDGRHAATVELAETWREGRDEALGELQALGIEAEILTGDPNYRPRGTEGSTGLSDAIWPPNSEPSERSDRQPAIRAGLTPVQKLARVRELTAAGHNVIFVGDGVNDAAAMSAAAAAVAMKAGAELARAAATAVFAGDDLRFLPRAVRVARAVRRNIRTNLWFAAAYNAVGMALAAGGVLHPVVAALLMVGSSGFVCVRALRSSGARETRS
jgi:cation transport ATPase